MYNANGTGHSWMSCILPFVEQQPLYDQIDFGLPVGDAAAYNVNTGVAQTVVAAFLCPSDINEGGMMANRANTTRAGTSSATDKRAITNYRACAGNNWGWGDAVCRFAEAKARWPDDPNGLDRGSGISCRNHDNRTENWTRFSDITDGTSNTFAVGEAVPKWCSCTWWYWFNSVTATCGIPLNYVPDTVRAGTLTMEQNVDDWPNNYSFMSRHPGGANFALCDGSVRFVMDTIDITTYRHLANISDAAPVQVP